MDEELSEIERSQELLREIIEETKRLSEESDALLKKHHCQDGDRSVG